MKKCCRCKFFKELDQFGKKCNSKDGLNHLCMTCNRQHVSLYKLQNPKKYQESQRKTTIKRKDKKSKYDETYRDKNKDKIANYKRDYMRTRCQTDILFRLKHNLRRRIHHVIRDNYKSASTMQLIGCTTKQFKLHIESQFVDNMSWDNYGPTGWHIDHIIPCCAFDLSNPEEQRKCFHYTNQQPLWAKDNLLKGKSI